VNLNIRTELTVENLYTLLIKPIPQKTEEETTIQPKNNAFEDYNLKLKEKIINLVNGGLLEEAKTLILDYKSFVNDDVEIYLLEAFIALMEGKMQEGEIFLKDGLKIDDNNVALLLTLSYIQSQSNNTTVALETYSKAKLFNPNNTIKVREIMSNLEPIDNSKLRILHGTVEIANQMSTITQGLRKLGVDAKSLNYYPNYFGYKCDYVVAVNAYKDKTQMNNKIKNLAAKFISENDVFHFHFASTLALDYSDLPLLKELDKKVFMQYWGSDVRMYSKAKALNRFVKVKTMNEEAIKRRLNFLSNHITKCIVSDWELYEYVKDIHDTIYLIRQAIDLEKYKVNIPNNKKLLIVLAPSSPEIKGTNYILEAIEKLKDHYDFEFILVNGMAHDKAKEIYAKADLIIDQILCGSYGLFAIESMAMGKPVISWISDFMTDKYPSELPIVSANPETIKDKIEYLLINKELLPELGARGRAYVEKYHDKDIIAKELLELYKSV